MDVHALPDSAVTAASRPGGTASLLLIRAFVSYVLYQFWRFIIPSRTLPMISMDNDDNQDKLTHGEGEFRQVIGLKADV